MTQIKESSTHNYNKERAINKCPINFVMSKIGGYWKPLIIYQLMSGSKRYSELRRAIPDVTEKMLIQHLKQLEADDLVIREAKPVVPPFVTYSLSASGRELSHTLEAMAEWGLRYNTEAL